MNEIFDIWKSDTVTGDREPEKPSICLFNNCIEACELLHKHFELGQNILIHCDVDVDGIGSGYITKRFCEYNTTGRIMYCINRDKIHGIQESQVGQVNNLSVKLGLLIIVDSSQNEIDIIRKLNCDVLVIDHHEVDESKKDRVVGKTIDGHDYIIVNNVLPGQNPEKVKQWLKQIGTETSEKIEPYESTDMMACGLTSYELYRFYQMAYDRQNMLENMMLYQWSAITLFTDAIQMLNERNQWYVQHTINQMEIEPTLEVLMRQLDRFQATVNKQFISFKLAPALNKAIRANAGNKALAVVLATPSSVNDLAPYADIQKKAVELGKKDPEYLGCMVYKDITNTGISRNYTGVIAASLSGDSHRQSAVYCVNNGRAQGSFRGISGQANYRSFFEKHGVGNFAQGHKAAFGIDIELNELYSIFRDLEQIESVASDIDYLTAGDVPLNLRGIHHIEDVNEFKRHGDLIRLAIGNSHVNSQEQIDIKVPLDEAEFIRQSGKVYIYKILGLTCKAFEPLTQDLVKVYVEQSNELNIYAKN